jgi:hypothetical protein
MEFPEGETHRKRNLAASAPTRLDLKLRNQESKCPVHTRPEPAAEPASKLLEQLGLFFSRGVAHDFAEQRQRIGLISCCETLGSFGEILSA